MACYGVFTGAREFAYRASVTSPLAGFGHSRLGISPGADLRDNGDHSYGKPGGVSACDSVFASSSKATPLSTYRTLYMNRSKRRSFFFNIIPIRAALV